MEKKQALPLLHKLSHSLPYSVTSDLEKSHSPGIPKATNSTYRQRLYVKDQKHPTLLTQPYVKHSYISATTHFRGQVILYNVQTVLPHILALDKAHPVFNLLYQKVLPFIESKSCSCWDLLSFFLATKEISKSLFPVTAFHFKHMYCFCALFNQPITCSYFLGKKTKPASHSQTMVSSKAPKGS